VAIPTIEGNNKVNPGGDSACFLEQHEEPVVSKARAKTKLSDQKVVSNIPRIIIVSR
jgi:hypothetical protein